MIGVRHRNGRVIHGVGLQRVWVPWRDPSCLCAFDADPGNYVKNGSGVSRWNDLTGRGNHALQSTAVNQPTWIEKDSVFGGRGSLSFGGSHYLKTGVFAAAIRQPCTIYTVANITSNNAAGVLTDGLTSYLLTYVRTNNTISMFAGGSDVGGTTDVRNTSGIVCASFNGASSQLFWNNFREAVATGNAGTNSATGLAIGCANNTWSFLIGKIACILVFSGVHSLGFRSQIGNHLGSKYGIATS